MTAKMSYEFSLA